MRIRMTGAVSSPEWSVKSGDIVEVPEDIGVAWIAEMLAELDQLVEAQVLDVHRPSTPAQAETLADEPKGDVPKVDETLADEPKGKQTAEPAAPPADA